MMTFGFSGRQSQEDRELITESNAIRAAMLAEMVVREQVVIYHQTRQGEVFTSPNPAFEQVVTTGYTYPQDWVATFQAFADELHADPDLLEIASAQGMDLDGLAYMIEQIREQSTGKL